MAKHKPRLKVFKPKQRTVSTAEPVVTILSLAGDGRGVAKLDGVRGKTVFVRDALPGEKVKIRFVTSKKQFDEAVVVEVQAKSDSRVRPPCQYYQICGGCDLQHLSYENQITHKEQQLQHLLTKQAPQEKQVNWLPPLTASPFNYRHRVRFSIIANKQGLKFGFKQKQSHQLVDVDSCLIADQAINNLLPVFKRLICELKKRSVLSECVISVDADNTLAAQLLVKSPLLDDDYLLIKAFSNKNQCTVKVNLIAEPYGDALFSSDDAELRYAINSLSVKYQVTDFTQVNTNINQLMVQQALNWLDVCSQDNVVDCFCGIGNLTLPLALKAQSVMGVELVSQMVSKATENAASNNLENVEFIKRDLFSAKLTVPQAFNKLVLDPPRAGAQAVCESAIPSNIQQILYISCNPATLARDVALLQLQGFVIDKAGLIDMFPQTHHMEAMVLLARPC